MNRYLVVTVSSVLLLTLCVPAAAGPPSTIPRVGIMVAESPPSVFLEAFREGLREFGYVDGRTITLEIRHAGGRPDRYAAFAEEFVRLNVDVIVSGGGTAGARAAKLATRTIPIVMPVVADPVAAGLVTNLARPEGNITGQSMLNTELSGKRLELLKEVSLSKIARIALLYDPAAETQQLGMTETAARALGLGVSILPARRAEDFEPSFEAARRAHADGMVVLASSFLNAHRSRLIELAAKHRLVAMYEHREFPEAGGLMSYGPNITSMYRHAALYVDKILKGAKPTDLPIQQPTKFELVINLKTAKALGLTIPQSLLLRADEIIQ